MNFLFLAARHHEVAPPPPVTSVQITDQNILGVSLTPDQASALYQLNTNSKAQFRTTPSLIVQNISGEWLTPADPIEADNYECRFTFVSKTGSSTFTGTLGVFLDLAATQAIEVTKSSNGVSSQTFDVEIRLKSTTINVATARIVLNVEVVF